MSTIKANAYLDASGGNTATINGATPVGTDTVQTLTNKTLTAPTITGGSLSGTSGAITQGTAQASTSGTAIDFTGIPSWAKRITVMLNGVSTSGASPVIVQLGVSGGPETSGYNGSATVLGSGIATTNTSTGVLLNMGTSDTSSAIRYGLISLSNLAANTWAFSANVGLSNASQGCVTSGAKSLSAALTQVRVTTVNGTDTFDAGTINIMYEG